MRRTGLSGRATPGPDCQARDCQRTHGHGHEERREAPPELGRHSSGQARVTISGKVHYLGTSGSLEAQQAYTRLIERWEANGRRPLDVAATAEQVRSTKAVLAEYLEYLDTTKHYHKDGKPTSARHNCRERIGEFMKSCGIVPVHKLSHVHVPRHRDTLEARADLSCTETT